MIKLIGLILIASSLLALLGGILIDLNYTSSHQITGNFISNMLTQPEVNMGFFDYVEAIAFSYSIVSLIMGVAFLFRV